MKKLFIIFMLQLLSLGAFAASGSASLFTPYPEQECRQTRAPFGYRPFYLSHFGRHGCRYMSDRSQVTAVLDVLCEAKKQGLLTEEGASLYRDFLAFDAAEEGMYGQLTSRGAAEHRHIAGRTFRRFKSVFSQRRRREIRCIASMYPRCIVSMASFCMELESRAPRLEIDLQAGVKYYKRLNTPDTTKALMAVREKGAYYLNPLFPSFFDDTAFFSRFFTNPTAARKLCDNWITFFIRFYDCACNVACAELDMDLRHYLTDGEMLGLMHYRNSIIFAEDGRNPLNWEERKKMVRVFRDEILTKANAAVAGNHVAADLRFGHDSGLSGLMSLIGIAGYDVESDPAEAWKVWDAAEMMPMASNLQFVFYKSCFRKEILVKVLFNEKETSIPALGSGPYYKWSSLQAYLESL